VISEVSVSRLALGPATGLAAFLLLTGGRLPWARPRTLGRAMLARWLGVAASAGLEEVIWRGIGLGGLQACLGPWPALALSSVAFALWHWPTLGDRCVVHVITGAAFGGAFLAGGIAASMLAHALYNMLVDWAVHAERARLRGP
jgi:membrane protease YdiL (CAAX protease family)